jgi:hypothetical protein
MSLFPDSVALTRCRQADCLDVFREFRKFYVDGEYCDLGFVCGTSDDGNDEVEIKNSAIVMCHSLVLSGLSPDLKAILAMSAGDDAGVWFISLPDCPASDAKKAVTVVYETLSGMNADMDGLEDAVYRGRFARCLRLTLGGGADVRSGSLLVDGFKVKVEENQDVAVDDGASDLSDGVDDDDFQFDSSNEEEWDDSGKIKVMKRKTRKRRRPPVAEDEDYVPATRKHRTGSKVDSKQCCFSVFASDGNNVDSYSDLGVSPTARLIVTNCGRLDKVAFQFSTIIGDALKRHKGTKYCFSAIVAVKEQKDGRYLAKPVIWSYPQTAVDVYNQFERARGMCKKNFNQTDCDIAKAFEPYWLDPNPRFHGRGTHQQLMQLKKFKDKLRTEMLAEQRKKTSEELKAFLRNGIEEQTAVVIYDEEELSGENPVTGITSQRIAIDFANIEYYTPDKRDICILIQWDQKGNVFYSNMSRYMERSLVIRTINDVWMAAPSCKKLTLWVSDMFRQKELPECIKRIIRGNVDHKQCDQCGEVFSLLTKADKVEFHLHKKQHQRKQEKSKGFECGACGLVFSTSYKRKQHAFQKEHDRDLVQCNKCKFVGTRSEVESHEKVVHKETLVCDVCGKSCDDRNKFNVHVAVHKEFLCTDCGQTVHGYSTYQKHRQSHVGPFPCDTCSYVGKSLVHLAAHKKNIHLPDAEKPYRCEVCGKGFVSRNKVDIHMMNLHVQSRPYACKFGCGAAYNDKSTLRQHEQRRHNTMH